MAELNNIHKMYMFLADLGQDWKTMMDKNGDGFLMKSEFSYFVEHRLTDKDWAQFNGYSTENKQDKKNDIINQFWNSIDINKSTTKIGNSRIYNQDALDKKESVDFDTKMRVTKTIYDFIQNKKPNEYYYSTALGSLAFTDGPDSDTTKWKQSLLESLLNSAFKDCKAQEINDEYLSKIYPVADAKTSADIYAQKLASYNVNKYKTTNEYIGYSLINLDYRISDDETLQGGIYSSGIISGYIKGINAESVPQPSEIVNSMKSMLNAYFGTADRNGGTQPELETLKDYYRPTTDSSLNDLQSAVLTAAWNRLISDSSSIESGEYDEETKNLISEYNYYKNSEKYGQYIKNGVHREVLQSDDTKKYVDLPGIYEVIENLVKSTTFGEYPTALANVKIDTIKAQLTELINSIRGIEEEDSGYDEEYDLDSTDTDSDTIKVPMNDLLINAGLLNKNTGAGVTNQEASFLISPSGQILFRNEYGDVGIFDTSVNVNSPTNTTMNALFYGDSSKPYPGLLETLKTQYKTELEAYCNGVDSNTANNLFNASLLFALSDTSVVSSLYTKSTDATELARNVIRIYTKFLQNMKNGDSETINYIQNYNSYSLLNGTVPASNLRDDGTNLSENSGNSREREVMSALRNNGYHFLDNYYRDLSTTDEDNTIPLDRLVTMLNPDTSKLSIAAFGARKDDFIGNHDHVEMYETAQYQDIYYSNEDHYDDTAYNLAMTMLYQNYSEKYSSDFPTVLNNEILSSLFKLAQVNAINKMKTFSAGADDCTSLNLYNVSTNNIYGFCKGYDEDVRNSMNTFVGGNSNCVHISSVILQTMYEMEILVGKRLLSVHGNTMDWNEYNDITVSKLDNNTDLCYTFNKGEVNTGKSDAISLSQLYTGNAIISLLGTMGATGDFGTNMRNVTSEAKTNLNNFIDGTLCSDTIKNKLTEGCSSTEKTKRETAFNAAKYALKAIYGSALDTLGSNWSNGHNSSSGFLGMGTTHTDKTMDWTVKYDGEEYKYSGRSCYRYAQAQGTDYLYSCKASNNDLGLRVTQLYEEKQACVRISAQCIMDMFSKLYKKYYG